MILRKKLMFSTFNVVVQIQETLTALLLLLMLSIFWIWIYQSLLIHFMLLKEIIEKAWLNRELLKEPSTVKVIEEVIEGIDKGSIRVAEPNGDDWIVNEWVKTAILHYFSIKNLEIIKSGELEYYDKIEPKKRQSLFTELI